LTEASDTLLIDCELVGLSTYTVTDTLSDASCSDILQVLDPFNLCTSSTSDLVDMTSYYRNGFLHLEGLPESTKEICISNISGQVLINTDKVDVIDLNSLSNNQIYVVTLLTEDRVRSWKLFVP